MPNLRSRKAIRRRQHRQGAAASTAASASEDAERPETFVQPTPERHGHDPIAIAPQAIADVDGMIGQPFRVVDTLGKMHAAGSITDAQLGAGDRFRNDFDAGRLQGIKAQDLSRPIVDGRIVTLAAIEFERARTRIWEAIRAAGGIDEQCGSCLWRVVGEGYSLAEWTLLQRKNGQYMRGNIASGILIGALGVLVGHYRAEDMKKSG